MDLKSLMNTESSEAKRAPPQRESISQAHAQSQSQPQPQSQAQAHAHAQAQAQAYAQLQLQQQTQQRNSIQPPPPRAASGSYGSPQSQHTPYAPKPAPPLYQQSSLDSRASNGAIPAPRLSTPLHTPVQTPGQMPAGAGYPFPSGPYQSPSQQQQQQQYRGHDGYQVVTPGGSRPPAPLYQQQHGQQAASSPYGAPQAPASAHHSASHSHTSMSPTPPALHHQSQTPHAARESAASYNHHPYPMHAHHPSQPSTPLGPPSAVQYPRQFAQPQSPYGLQHHRTSSGASHGPTHSMASNSPAQPMAMALGNMAESPAAYGPAGAPRRAASGGYVSEAERERSISVSPKTRVIPRQGSQGSFYSGHDPMSARNSISASQTDFDRPSQSQSQSHLSHPSHPSHQPPPQHEPQHMRSSDDMSHGISPLTNTRQQPIPLQPAAPIPSPSSRSSQTPKLTNLLNDTTMVAASPVRQSSAAAATSFATPQRQFSPHAHPPKSDVSRHSSNSYEAPVKLEPAPLIKSESSGFTRESLLQQPVTTPARAHTPIMPSVQKRPATTTPESAHPVKRAKKRYAEPPIWARFAKSNPRYGNNPQSLAPPPQQLVRRPSPHSQARIASGQQAPPPTNGHAPQVVANGTPTATQSKLPPPVNSRLGPWEPNVKNMQLIDDVVKDVGDFLFYQVTRMDIGVGDLRSGTLEIEAKLGTIIDKRTNNRVATMGISNTVLDTAVTSSGNLRFESFMTELQHKQMNDFLNKMVQASMGPNRVKMNYKHRYERDSFAQLNQYGLAALPPAAKAHLRPGQVPKLRTSVDTRAPEGSPQAILGRIVKVRLDDLDIHCPKMDFDCRISVNVEVDLNNRPDVDPALIVDQQPPDSAGDRMKDRLSYQHLAYSVDLTQVTVGGGKKSHELEVEVDTARLREEAVRLQRGQDSGYEAMVDGLLSNVFMLMKASKDMGRQGVGQ